MNSTAVEQALQSLTIALTEDGTITANSSVSFSGNIYDKGFYWAGSDYTKKFVMVADEDRLFSSETIGDFLLLHFTQVPLNSFTDISVI